MASVLRRLATATASSRSTATMRSTQPVRAVSNYYGSLERNVRNSAGAMPQAIDIPYIDRIRAEHLLQVRMHLGHHKRRMDRGVSGAIYGFRHNVAVFDITKSWASLRTVFYGFAEMAQVRSSFFLLAPNSQIPLDPLIKRMEKEYPFRYHRFSSLHMVAYSDKQWLDGTLSNWKNTVAYYESVKRKLATGKGGSRLKKLSRCLRGIDNLDVMSRVLPDFMLVFAADRGAFHEARNLDLPMIGMVDSNVNPAPFLYPVYGNDDSVEALEFMMEVLKRGVEEGRKREHEAFATLLIRKIKSKLTPANARMGLERASDADLAGTGAGDDDLSDLEGNSVNTAQEGFRGAGEGPRSVSGRTRDRVMSEEAIIRRATLENRQPSAKFPQASGTSRMANRKFPGF